MRFIGDVHTKIEKYIAVATGAPRSIQVGDLGIGLCLEPQEQSLRRFHDQHGTDHRFIRGNHDNPHACLSEPAHIRDGHLDHALSILHIGGAQSYHIDRQTPGLDWWPEEQINAPAFEQILTTAVAHKPRVIVSHDGPHSVLQDLFYRGPHRPIRPNQTSMFLQWLFELHQPEIWVFGHWHLHRDTEIMGTRFICLEELQHIDIDLAGSDE